MDIGRIESEWNRRVAASSIHAGKTMHDRDLGVQMINHALVSNKRSASAGDEVNAEREVLRCAIGSRVGVLLVHGHSAARPPRTFIASTLPLTPTTAHAKYGGSHNRRIRGFLCDMPFDRH